jgi:hypothetical protein
VPHSGRFAASAILIVAVIASVAFVGIANLSGGPGAIALLIAGLVLTYVFLGVPLRSVAGLLERASGRPATMLSLEAGLAVVLRACVGLLALAVLGIPYAIAAGCIVMLIAVILALREGPTAPTKNETAPTPSRASVVLANAINDVYAGTPGILGIALLARHDPWWLAIGLALALVASVPAVIAARRRLRREPAARLATTAVLGVLFGATAIAGPDLMAHFEDTAMPTLASAFTFALTVLGAGRWMQVNRRSPMPVS